MDNQEPRWFCVNTASGFEKAANDRLRSKGIETLYPRLSTTRTYFYSKPKPVILPLFPRYLFAFCSLQDYQHAALNQRKEVLSLLRFSSGPAIVSEAIISEIRARLDADGVLLRERLSELTQGAAIRVVSGPLTGYEGLFQRGDKERVWALIRAIDDSTLNPQIAQKPVMVYRSQIEALA